MPLVLPDLNSLVESLEMRVKELERRPSIVAVGGSLIVPIQTFAPEPFAPLKEIRVVVEESDGEFIASFFDANVSAGGSNPQEAVDNLKENLLSCFDYLSSLPPEKLGAGPKKQLAVLREFIGRSG
jgi:hypothetical protein